MTQQIDLREFIDENRVSPMQKLVIFLCLMIVVVDGIDISIMGFVAPVIKQEWGISTTDLAPVMSAALIGLALGAVVSGPLADKFGRKKLLIINLFGFGIFTLLAALSSGVNELMIYRFIAGLFMGGVMPQAVTLVTDYAPMRLNGRMVTIILSGFTIGAAIGGFLAAWVIPHYNWHAMMIIGGVLPLILAIVAIFVLPESIGYKVLKQHPKEEIDAIILKMDPTFDTRNKVFVLPKAKTSTTNPVKTVVSPFYIFGSFLLWWSYASGLFVVYLLGSWLPMMSHEFGFSISEASLITAIYQLGGPIGCVVCGFLMDKVNRHLGLVIAYILAIGFMIFVGQVGHNFVMYSVMCFFIGMWMNGANAGLNSVSSSFYPVFARATGNSWMHGIGRLGAVASAFAGAYFINLGWPASKIFLILCLPTFGIMMALILMKFFYSPKKLHQQELNNVQA
ncbi:AAHS family 4-hydroxybenzoate transporter-like MFS transporter [Acinetobacter baylyi]|uniref:AAHS family 4-hydroxybenzoate transporter-like MFS transporter n=1 Tax=Acinetobacter baylyi TaxID=202950 RepID=A0ABU0V1E8_ACIBI|nr:MFS transporter [Acinetobacter baylyi]MDQ1210629.1 AAHS family 4-hydroxybenzoate transporter-like MFS transporter [Acinetobacter baylyi]MDR6105777.1 AAHS family 4-hydroxybenzoate transporter-like MFS transporter [Acinetobacter baylyi]MDR6187503.1 AAHS family 4-hydroxybenzoate transporter-like MFS transporter [Acinetobacter baylyi]